MILDTLFLDYCAVKFMVNEKKKCFIVNFDHYYWIVINIILTQNGSSTIGVSFPDLKE